MAEKLYTGQLAIDDFPSFIENCHFPQGALVLAEQLPEYVVDDTKKLRDLLRFMYFKPEQGTLLASYTSGRIFHEDGELRWEKQGNKMCLVYLGDEQYISALHDDTLRENQALHKLTLQQESRHYYLFGERLKDEDIQKMGKMARPGDFAQVRIPHILRYPSVQQSSGRYARLKVREYVDAGTGQTMLFRFQSLEAVEGV